MGMTKEVNSLLSQVTGKPGPKVKCIFSIKSHVLFSGHQLVGLGP